VRGHVGSLRKARDVYKPDCGRGVRSGHRQSIPSSNIESCAWLRRTVPARAMRDTDAPAASASYAIAFFCSAVKERRFGLIGLDSGGI
jgi:hypothetical protein